jgi:MSHA pilin protein MshD
MCIPASRRNRNRGFTLMELLLLVVVFSVGLAGILTVYVNAVAGSADPLVRKQALAIAESLMEEIMLQPFSAGTPHGATRNTFDEVGDYNGYSSTGVVDIYGTPVSGLSSYNVGVAVVPAALNTVTSANSREITVTVTRGAFTLSVQGYRVNY